MHLFADDLIRYGDDTALITEENERVTYAELAARADAFGDELHRLSGKPRGLLMLEMRNTSEAIAAYLGALRARWPVILAAAGTAGPESEILQRFAPDLVYRFEHDRGRLERSDHAPADVALHPDLAVMLSTSGSTGSAKLVKLSRENLQANAQSIAEYLAIGPDRIAITDLPGHYSYGLSIINSFLESGAALALTEASVVEDRFWAIFDQAAATDLAGVPYTYELLERLGFRNNPPASLKVMTQAGGRLAPELVERYAAFAQAADMRFFVMYGQTEATARMAYLPPELAQENPTCIGLPIPRGTFLLRDEDGRDVTDPLVPGELVYRGPNVMMGYAGMPADLAGGPSLEALATGDIALRQENGLYRIVGRTSRFSKIAGLRIGHDDVEAILRSASMPGFVTGNDETLVIALEAGEADAASHLIAERCGLPIAALHAWRPDEIPRLATGKVDYAGLKRTGLERAAEAAAAQAATPTNDVARLYSRGLNRVDPAPDASFLDLGGDSLAYISVSIGLEEMLGHLPEQWQTMPIRSLQLLADRATPATERRRTLISTDVLLRLLAITLVFIGHAAPTETEMLRGGAGILFLLAGYSMAIRQLPQLIEGRIGHVIKGTSRRLVLPYYVAATGPIIALHIVKPWSWYAFVSLIVVPPLERRVLYSYWFFEDLVLSTLFVCVLFLIPPFRRAFARHPFAVSVTTTLATVAFCAFGAKTWHTGITVNLTLDAWLYVFMAGWTAGFARSALQKSIIIGLSVVAMLFQFGPEVSRPYWFAFALVALLTISAIPIKRNLRTAIVYLAGATYFMYLSPPLVVDLVRFRLATTLGTVPHIILVVIGSILCGVIGMEVWNRVMLMLQRLLRMTYNRRRT